MKRSLRSVSCALCCAALTMTRLAHAAEPPSATPAAAPQPAAASTAASTNVSPTVSPTPLGAAGSGAAAPIPTNATAPTEPSRLPPRLPYEEGAAIPPQYVLETTYRKAIIIPGSVIFGASWAISAAAAIGLKNGELAVPVAGPWLVLAGLNTCSGEECNPLATTVETSVQALLVIDGLVQTAGFLILVGGLIAPRKELVRKDLMPVTVLPSRIGTSGYGLSAIGRF